MSGNQSDTDKLNAIDQKLACLISERIDFLQGLPRLESGEIPHLKFPLMDTDNFKIKPQVYKEIYDLIFNHSSVSSKVSVSFLGPEGTFSHEAVRESFGAYANALPQDSIIDIFESVYDRQSEFGIVPVENSVEGAVNVTLDLLRDSELYIVGELTLEIFLNLIGVGPVEEIKEVYSHPQPLAQCRRWLRSHIPGVVLRSSASTASAVKLIENNPKVAAVGPKMAADIHGYSLLASGIQDYKFNKTRFLILSRHPKKSNNDPKTSIVFLCPDRPGTLVDVLQVFKKHQINLSKIESRPSKKKDWEYTFFVDFIGDQKQENVKEALDEIKQQVLFLKCLGSYSSLNFKISE